MRLSSFILLMLLGLICPNSSSAQQRISSSVTHPWQGKRIAYFGDSITDPRNKASKKKYWGFLGEWLDLTTYVYGVSGRQWNDIPRQANLLKTEHGDEVDAILVFMGTNDYNNAVPIGQWYTEKMSNVEYGHGYVKRKEARMQRILCKDASTYCGRINIALDTLKQLFPTKQIVLLTPIHRGGFYANEKNWQCTEDYQNRCGEYLENYVEAVKEAGNLWAVPVIDLHSLCGLYPMLDVHAQYFNNGSTDRLHPNAAGHERIAKTLYYQLLSLPCHF